MGEVENAAIAIEYTGLIQARTIAKYQFFTDVAAKFGKTKKEIEGFKIADVKDMIGPSPLLNEEYIQIPLTKIEGKNIPRYGRLGR
jgi:hypothetical protein